MCVGESVHAKSQTYVLHYHTCTLNFTVPAFTRYDSAPLVGVIIPDSMKMYVITLRVATSLTKDVLKVSEFALMPDTEVWTSSPKVKSVFEKVFRLGKHLSEKTEG